MLTLQADELITAFEGNNYGMHHFLDRQTGELLFISDDIPTEDVQERIDEDIERYAAIEPVPSHESFQIMENFVESLPGGKARRDLANAINQHKPFRRFKDTLLAYPDLREQWFRFHEQAFIEIIKEWLEDHKIEATVIPFHKSPPKD